MFKRIVVTVAFVSLAACMSQAPQPVMGTSVAQMVESQIHNHDAVNNPPKGVVGGLDGGAGEKIISAYRQGGKKSAPVNEQIEFGGRDK